MAAEKSGAGKVRATSRQPVATPTAAQSEQNAINGLTLEKYGIDISATSGVTPGADSGRTLGNATSFAGVGAIG